MYVTQRSARGVVGFLIEPLTPFAKRSHRLALCLSATYGRTLSKASGDLIKVRIATSMCVLIVRD
jgi:hypothetical protein